MSKELEILKKARELISDPEHWCQGSAARNQNDNPVHSKSSAACKFCAVGAINRASFELDPTADEGREAAYVALRDTVDELVTVFNDTQPHEKVLAAFDDTIKRLEEREHVPGT